MIALLSQSVNEWAVLLAVVTVTLGPSLLNARLTRESISTWYVGLKKPRWTPPGWVFGPVWTALYLSMSVAVWLVWKADPGAALPLKLYLLQLAINHAWSPVFFKLRNLTAAFYVLLALWFSVAATTLSFAFVTAAAGKLMVPYLMWVSYALALNYRIWLDNQGKYKPIFFGRGRLRK